MSGRIRHTDEFEQEAAAQISKQGHFIKSLAERLSVNTKSL